MEDDFNRGQWIDEAGVLWARIVTSKSTEFPSSPDWPRLQKLLAGVGIGVEPASAKAWKAETSVSERYLETAELEDLGRYFSWLKSMPHDVVEHELRRWCIRAALGRLIERVDELPYDGRASPRLECAA